MEYKIKLIKNNKDYQEALEFLDFRDDFIDFDRIEIVTILVEEYEKERYKINLPNPIEAIKFRMKQMNLKQKDLIPYIGSKSKVSEIMSGKRKLNLRMIRNLHKKFDISLEVLIN